MQYELIIIGGGPAGAAAAVYAARKKIKTAMVADLVGGQSIVSQDIHNWIGETSISGLDLAKKFENHVKAYSEVELFKDLVVGIEKEEEGFRVTTKAGKVVTARTVLLALGAKRRKLNVPGEAEHEGRGVVYCATCDAPLFQGKEVAVVGGGNAGLESVVDLLPYATKIYLLVRSNELKGDQVTQETVRKSEKVEIIYKAETKEIKGETLVEGLVYKDITTGEEKEIKVGGVFVEIGSIPNSDMVKGLVNLNERGEVIVDHKTQRSSLVGIWAAGDVSDVLYKQNNISAGDAVKAVLNIQEYLNKEAGR